MNAANIVTLLFCLAMISIITLIFSERWHTFYGARIPLHHVQQKWMLLFPAFFLILGVYSFSTSGWNTPIETLPKWLALTAFLTLVICFIRWYKSSDPMRVPLDTVIKYYWPHAQRINLENPISEDIKNLLHIADIFTITNTPGIQLFQFYLEYIKSLGHTPVDDVIVGVFGSQEKMYCFYTKEQTPVEELRYEHRVVHVTYASIVAFSSQVI